MQIFLEHVDKSVLLQIIIACDDIIPFYIFSACSRKLRRIFSSVSCDRYFAVHVPKISTTHQNNNKYLDLSIALNKMSWVIEQGSKH